MAQLQIRDITPAFGAEVVGVEPGAELDEESRRRLRDAFDNRGLLVFRGIDIDREYQTYLIDGLIGYERPATAAGQRQLLVSNKEPSGLAPFGRLLFHTDMMWAPEPFQVLSLYGVEVAPPSVPTAFVSTTYAWDTLPTDLKARVAGLHAVHATGQQRRGGYEEDDLLEAIRDQERSVTWPIGRRHPRTGREMLYISQMNTSEIVELEHDESEELLEALFAHLYAPATTWEHDWRSGDLVVWDNLATQHARSVVKAEGPVRTLRKVISPIPTLVGTAEVPRYANQG
jgi:taurine dioxygenase